MLENEAKQKLLEELEGELDKVQSHRKQMLLEIEKLHIKKEFIRNIASDIEDDDAKQRYLDYFDIEGVEKDHETLREKFYNLEKGDPISYLKATISRLKTTM